MKINVKIDLDDVEYTVTCLPSELDLRGNAVASGDPDYDRSREDAILEDLEHNPWAWCTVKVCATLGPHSGYDILGGCSYQDEDDFRERGEFGNMKEVALADLLASLPVPEWSSTWPTEAGWYWTCCPDLGPKLAAAELHFDGGGVFARRQGSMFTPQSNMLLWGERIPEPEPPSAHNIVIQRDQP